jgi:serine/threonine protein kinase
MLKVDIWSLGMISYYLMNLSYRKDRMTLSNSRYSLELISLVSKMLSEEPDERPNIDEILCSIVELKKRLYGPCANDKLSSALDSSKPMLCNRTFDICMAKKTRSFLLAFREKMAKFINNGTKYYLN